MAVILTGTEYIDLDTHGAALDFDGPPLSLYAELDTTTTTTMFVYLHGRSAGGGNGGEYGFYCASGNLVVRVNGDDRTGPSVADGVLHRVCLAFRSSGAAQLYVDGVEVIDTTFVTSISEVNDLTAIGTDPNDPGNFGFVGELSSIAVWATDLSATDAQDLTAGTITPGDLLTGIVEWWPLDFDARGEVNNLDGTTVGDPEFTESAGTPYDRVTETETARAFAASKAAAFDRTTEAETVRDFTTTKTADFSRVTEAETAQAFTAAFGHSYGRVTETEQAREFTASKSTAFGRVVETETARVFFLGEIPEPEPIILPPFREPAVPDFQESAVPAYRETKTAAFQEAS